MKEGKHHITVSSYFSSLYNSLLRFGCVDISVLFPFSCFCSHRFSTVIIILSSTRVSSFAYIFCGRVYLEWFYLFVLTLVGVVIDYVMKLVCLFL